MRAWLALPLILLLAGCDVVEIEACSGTSAVTVLCGFDHPEDIVALTGSDYLLVSNMGIGTAAGRLDLLDPVSGDRVDLTANASESADAACAPPERFKPGGIDARPNPDGGWDVLAVNRGGPIRIERYRLTFAEDGPNLAWTGCVAADPGLFLNDVAFLGADALVASHMLTPVSGWRANLNLLRFLTGARTGHAVAWAPVGGWRKLAGSDVSFANGIAVDPAGLVYLAATFGRSITRIDPNAADGAPRTTRLPLQPDNLAWTDDGGLTAAGNTGLPVLATRGCRTLAPERSCGFPSAVVRYDPQTGAVTRLFADDGSRVPGASVGLLHRGRLFLGTAFGDRISIR